MCIKNELWHKRHFFCQMPLCFLLSKESDDILDRKQSGNERAGRERNRERGEKMSGESNADKTGNGRESLGEEEHRAKAMGKEPCCQGGYNEIRERKNKTDRLEGEGNHDSYEKIEYEIHEERSHARASCKDRIKCRDKKAAQEKDTDEKDKKAGNA